LQIVVVGTSEASLQDAAADDDDDVLATAAAPLICVASSQATQPPNLNGQQPLF